MDKENYQVSNAHLRRNTCPDILKPQQIKLGGGSEPQQNEIALLVLRDLVKKIVSDPQVNLNETCAVIQAISSTFEGDSTVDQEFDSAIDIYPEKADILLKAKGIVRFAEVDSDGGEADDQEDSFDDEVFGDDLSEKISEMRMSASLARTYHGSSSIVSPGSSRSGSWNAKNASAETGKSLISRDRTKTAPALMKLSQSMTEYGSKTPMKDIRLAQLKKESISKSNPACLAGKMQRSSSSEDFIKIHLLMTSKDWEAHMKAIEIIDSAAATGHDVLLPDMPKIVEFVLLCGDSGRSKLKIRAMDCIERLFSIIPKLLYPYLERIVPNILKKSSDASHFIQEKVDAILKVFASNIPANRALPVVLPMRTSKHAAVRAKVSISVESIVVGMGTRVKKMRQSELIDLLNGVVALIEDRSPDVRNPAKSVCRILSGIWGKEQFLALCKKVILNGKAEVVKKVVESGTPRPGSFISRNYEEKGAEGRSRSHMNPKSPKSKGNVGTLASKNGDRGKNLDMAYQNLLSTDWMARMAGIETISSILKNSSYGSFSESLPTITRALVDHVDDQNERIAIETIGLFIQHSNVVQPTLNQVAPQLFSALVRNISSGKGQIKSKSQQLLSLTIQNTNSTTMLNSMINALDDSSSGRRARPIILGYVKDILRKDYRSNSEVVAVKIYPLVMKMLSQDQKPSSDSSLGELVKFLYTKDKREFVQYIQSSSPGNSACIMAMIDS